jgi:hypothetical protein
MKRFFAIGGLVSALFLSSCGMFSTKETGKKAEQNSSDLAATWELGCVKLDFLGFLGHKEELSFSAVGDFQRKKRVYDNANCETEVGSFNTTGTYAVLGATASTNDGTRDINLTLNTFDVTVSTDSLVKAMNEAKFCGLDNWAVNQKVNLLGLDCAIGKVSRGDVVYEIFLVDNNILYFSDQLGVVGHRVASSRPEKLDMSRPYVKK